MLRQNKTEEVDLDTRKTLNSLARHKMITRLYADILVDMQICEIEGWDKLEYINELKSLINSFRT
jgi:hypothetical protein